MISIAKKIAVIGAGGKTTLLRMLAAHKRAHRVLLTTTTHIFPVYPPESDRLYLSPQPDELCAALCFPGITCAGTMQGDARKLSCLPRELLMLAEHYADYILYEADGARRMPLKLHSETEPVILPDTAHCIIVAGLSALGKPLSECVHRYALCPEWADTPERPVDFEIISTCVLDAVRASQLPTECLTVLLNQSDACTQPCEELVQTLTAHGLRCAAVSLQTDGLPNLISDL